MQINLSFSGKNYSCNLQKPIDISLPVADLTRAWYIDPPKFTPVKLGDDWIGSIEKGGDVNFFDIRFNPHAHGTHTECLGHVTKERHSVNQALEGSWFVAELITVETSDIKGDKIITATEIDKELKHLGVEAVIIRTRPNDPEKATANLSDSNWPYMDEEAARFLCRHNIQHLLIDQPSVDKEEDGGRLAAHKAFWDVYGEPREKATITELIFIPDEVPNGLYLLNLQVAPMENDAAPSRPVLFHLDEEMMI
jgi:arylformamidase